MNDDGRPPKEPATANNTSTATVPATGAGARLDSNGVDVLTAALAGAEYGLHVFPVDHPGQPTCVGAHKPENPCDGQRGKHPAVAWSTWAATNTPQMIKDAWAKRGGLCNIGIACGPSGLVVLDEDEQGALQRWCDARGITLPPTYTVDTGRGRHLYFRWDHDVQRIGNGEKAFTGYKINVRGAGGYVVGAASVHVSGAVYTGNGLPMAPLPPEVAGILLAGIQNTNGQNTSGRDFWQPVADPNVTMIADGQRHNALIAYAGRLRGKGLDYAEAEPTFRARWQLCEQPESQIPEAAFHTATCRSPITWEEAQEKLRDIYVRYPAGEDGDPAPAVGRLEQMADDGPPDRPATPTLAGRLLTRSALRDLADPEPLIDNVIDQGTCALLYGHRGTYKSFIALDWALSVATGRPWQGRPTEQRRVLYVAAEGAFGFKGRTDAWEIGWQRPVSDDDFLILPKPVNLTDPGEVAELGALIEWGGYGLVVLDTMARCTVGAEENSAKDIGQVVDQMYRLLNLTPDGRGVVLGVHHTGKDGNRLRGSSAYEAGVDSLYSVKRPDRGGPVILDREKRKDGPESDRHELKLALIDGTNSGVMQAVNLSTLGADKSNKGEQLLSTFVQTFPTTGASKAELRAVSGMPPSTFYRAVNELLKSGDLINTATDKQPFYMMVSK
ncbi:AAA family ATPase [Mycolicibacterium fluoranthenivorans]|uniref:Bifunctional DNA primase/polymerase, N-terminal n=1 Tax=Mycolicibacterium fluoranthenivorans TaxID=258505 RepID=A0A1G4WQ30_9MYCO|nr:AAA family ATPase [Mycolicibacterium fluoranthenivorans]SCX27220.1 Bifunctional DNA primase/polymerase, N-terminal [Mycolicibacterium fluoranthenivorans]